LIQHDHRAKQDGAAHRFGTQQEQGGGDVGAVGEAQRDQPRGIQVILFASTRYEIGQRVGASSDFPGVKNPFRHAGEKTQRPPLTHVTARAEQRCAWRDRATDAQQIVFAPPGAMEEEKGWSSGRRARLKKVMIGEDSHGNRDCRRRVRFR